MKCPRCQYENSADAAFCDECGARVEATCPSCGEVNRAGAKFCRKCGEGLIQAAATRLGPVSKLAPPESYTPKHLAEKILTSKSAIEGERKQVTVLFADLKGSMELLADRDPEEARKILDPVLERMMEAVHRYEGTVNQVMGDGIMALFGAPLAHEDHAVRACYAALRMQEGVKKYAEEARRSHAAVVKIRVGLNSGEVVVRAIGSDLHMDYTAVGQTTHLAARMEQLAEPGAIVISPETLALVEGYVEVKSLGPVPVKGLTAPIEIYEVTSAGAARTRLQASARRGLTRFVGRDAELEQLRRAQQLAGDGRGQVAAIVGEAGVGKSRLVYELTHSHRLQGWLMLESASVSYGKATSWLPVIELLKAYFKINSRDDHREIREKVTGKLLTLDEALKPTLPALLALLEAPIDDTSWQALDPAQRRQRTLDAVKHLLLREAREQPMLLIFEDLHWIDSETQVLLDGLVESLGSARLLLLVNYRPEYQHAWGSRTYYSQMRLDALPVESAAELLGALLGDDAGLAPLKQLLTKRGNPFFLEETVRTLIETRALVGERGRYRLTQTIQSIQVPPTVQTILAARIDRLTPEDKHLLQVASVIGKDVPFALLQAIADRSDEAIRSGLDHLQAAEFIYETGLFPEIEYTFKHALTHEVTYGGMLQERRRELHARIVPAIEVLHRDRLGEQIERLAHHALRGAVWDKAVAYLQQSGEKAYALSAHREAVAFWESALACIEHLPSSRELIETGIVLHMRLRNSLTQLGEQARQVEHLRQAEKLAEAVGDQRRLTQVSSLLANYFLISGDTEQALAWAHRALAHVTALDDIDTRIMVNVHMGQIDYAVGNYRAGTARLEENLCSIPSARDHEFFDLAVPASILSRSFRATCLAELGEFNEAIAIAEEAVRLAESFDRMLDRVYAYRALASVRLRKGNCVSAVSVLERGMELCRDAHFPRLLTAFTSMLGYAHAISGRATDALRLLDESVKSPLFMQSSFHLWQWICVGEAYLAIDRIEEGKYVAGRVLDFARRQQAAGSEAWVLWLLGEIDSHGNAADLATALNRYDQALALAMERHMRPLVAHCQLGLGKLYRKTGKQDEACEHLNTATAMYREMDMRYWLEQAEVELVQLA